MMNSASEEYLCCRSGTADIAVAASGVQEVFETRSITRVPRTPGFVVGMANVRGVVVPVLNPLGASVTETGDRKIVVLKTTEGPVGLLITQLIDLLRFDRVEAATEASAQRSPFAAAFPQRGVCGEGMFDVMDVETMIRSTLPPKGR